MAWIQSLGQELPYAVGAAIRFFKIYERKKERERKKEGRKEGKKERKKDGVPIVAQWLMNPSRNHEDSGSIPGLAQ